MQKRTNLLLTALVLLLVAGAGAAEGAMRANASVEAGPGERPAEPAFVARLSGTDARVAPGTTAAFQVDFEAREPTSLALRVRAPEALAVELSRDNLSVAPGAPASVALTARVPADAEPGPRVVEVEIVSAAGEARTLRAMLHVGPPPGSPDAPRAADPPASVEERIERRIARIEQLLHGLGLPWFAHEPRPAPLGADAQVCAAPDPGASCVRAVARVEAAPAPASREGIRALLSEANATIDPSGGRVALLLEAGDRPVALALRLRSDPASGWTVGLETRRVELPAHGRTWVMVHLDPNEGSERTRYAIEVAEETRDSMLPEEGSPPKEMRVVQGTARVAPRMP